MDVILIGYRGTGKTTVARLLAARFNVDWWGRRPGDPAARRQDDQGDLYRRGGSWFPNPRGTGDCRVSAACSRHLGRRRGCDSSEREPRSSAKCRRRVVNRPVADDLYASCGRSGVAVATAESDHERRDSGDRSHFGGARAALSALCRPHRFDGVQDG